jgi:hypothetical protein
VSSASSFRARLVAAIVTGCALFALADAARGQAGPPLATDDPETPGDGRFEVNLSSTLERFGGTSTYEAPLLDVNYGLGPRVQLKYELPWVFVDDDDRSANGLGNSLVGVKWRYHDAGDDGFAMSVYPQVEFENPGSSSARRGLADHGTGVILPVQVARDFGPCDGVLEAGYVVQDRGADRWFAGLACARSWIGDGELLAELRAEAGRTFEDSLGFWDVGIRAPLGGSRTLLAAIGHGLWSSGEEDTPGLRVFVGLQFAR